MIKKFVMMCLIAAPFAAFSQAKLSPASDKQESPKKTEMGAPSSDKAPEALYGEIIITTNNMGGTVIRLEFGKEAMTQLEDKELITAIGEARKRQFTNVPDALTFMNTLGYKYLSSYTFGEGAKGETHLVLENRLNAKKGERPGRPAPTGVKPVVNDKAPAKGDKK